MRPFATFVLALTLAAGNALAADPSADPPTRVGRIAWTEGEVAAWLEADRGWEKAYVNTPLTSENSLWTEPRARAEVRIGSTAIRLDEATQLDMRRLEDVLLRAHVVRGSVSVRIRNFERDERYTLSTPQARFQLITNGRFRIDAEEDTGESRLTVFAGSANLVASGRRVTVNAGEAVRVYAEGGGFDFERAATREFDDWSLARDERLSDRQSSRYVSPQMTGYEDLDQYGSWTAEPEYGAVWYPSRIGADWAPYRTGHWAWVRPWGWTWIDDSPWGYAPFHYGRWLYVGNRWGWSPGRYVPRPVWAPALVGWVGGANWSLTISSRNAPVVGWYPLAPWDRYQPWYTNNVTYINNVNVIVRNAPPRLRDQDRDHNRFHGATVMPRDGFVSRRPVAGAGVPVPRDVLAAQPVVTGASVLPPRSEVPRSRPLTLGAPSSAPQQPAMRGEPVGSAPAAPRGQPSALAPASPRGQPAAVPSAPSAPSAPVQPSVPTRGEPARPVTPIEVRSKPPARGESALSPTPAAAPRSPAYREPPAASPQPAQRVAPSQPSPRAAPREQPQVQPREQPQAPARQQQSEPKPQAEPKPVTSKPAREEKPVTGKPQKDKD